MAMNLKPLHRQTIVITGATSGIGLATAHAAAQAGARVMLAARNADALAAVRANLLERHGWKRPGIAVETLAVDTGDADYAARLAAATIECFGGFDTWINNAAAATYGTLAQTPIADQRRVFDVGYWGTVNGALAAMAHLQSNGGAIINLGSVLSERAMIQQGPYSAMKHAVKGFTDALRTEVMQGGLPISVTLIKPSAMHTPYPEHARNRMDAPARLPPLLYDPRLVARAILFCAAHPRREVMVGGFGAAAKLGNLLLPGGLDRAMAATGTAAQQTDQPAPAGVADNLYDARADGSIDGHQQHHVRRHSLWMEAQLRPAAALGLAVLGIGAVGLGLRGLRAKA